MSDEITKGSFEATSSDLYSILNWASAPFDDRYDQVYLNLASDELRTIANAGESVSSYCTFGSSMVQDVELHDSVDESAGMEAVVNVDYFKDYLSFVGGERVRVEFHGIEGQRESTKMTIDGDLTANIFIPSSQSDYESKQLSVVKLYNNEDEWVKPSTFNMEGQSANHGEPLSTSFVTKVEEFQKIVEVTDFDDIVLSNYPVVIEDGEFLLDAEDDEARNSISGTLYAEDVEGPDVDNTYSRGFQELFSSIGGMIDVGIEDNAPISIVQKENGYTLRYAILPTE